MIAESSALQGPGDMLRWLLGLVAAIVLHLLVFFLLLAKHANPVPQQATAAVMLQFSDSTQSIRIQHELPVGPPQVVTTDSQAARPETSEAIDAKQQLKVDEAPHAPDPRLVVEQNTARQSDNTRKSRKHEKPREHPKQKPLRAATTRHTPSDTQSHASAQSVSAPQPGESSQVTAPYDSRSQHSGHEENWQARVLGYLARNQGYPAQALAAHIEGRVLTTVTIDRQGNILAVQLRKSSGFAVLDQHALRAISSKSPIPRPPADIIRDLSQLKLNIPVDFNVRKYRMRTSM